MASCSVSTLSESDENYLEKMFEEFKKLGCCGYCCLRFTGVTDAKVFNNYQVTKNEEGHEESSENGVARKIQKLNPCLACLGILHSSFCEEASDMIMKKVEEEGYESNTFNLAVTLPIACQIRAQSMWYYIMEKYPVLFKKLFPFGCVTITPKDVTKWLIAPKIEIKTGMKFEPKSDFIINIFVDYQDNKSECSGLFQLFPETFKSHRKRGLSSVSRKAVDDQFNNTLCEDDFRQEYPCPPAIPDFSGKLDVVTFTHNSVFVAGRYCKFSRQLPQTPWVVGVERKMESSVQEKISKPLERFFRSTVSKFGASGREDVDVRMLGRGRPFNVELINPKRSKLSFEQMRQVEAEINKTSLGLISVRHLQVVPKASLIDLKSGEEEKCKLYNALCAITVGYRHALMDSIKVLPIELDQSTPVRVLHRRPVALRKRTIHYMSISFPEINKSPIEGTELVYVELKTQAGTYVKEFIHGDMGRTTPSLKSLTGAPFVDIIALDVKDVEMDWPPVVSYQDD